MLFDYVPTGHNTNNTDVAAKSTKRIQMKTSNSLFADFFDVFLQT